MGEVVDRVALDDGLELTRRLGVAPAAEVGAAERLPNRALLGRQPSGLRERHRGRGEVPRLEQGHAPLVEASRGNRPSRRPSTKCRAGRREPGDSDASALVYRVPLAACSRSASTRSRMAAATSSLGASGTRRSPSRSTITTSLSAESKPISARETSLKTIASSPLRSSFERARSIASGAVLGRETDQGLVVASQRREIGEEVLGLLEAKVEAAAALAGDLPRLRHGRPEVGDGGGHQQHVAGRELLAQRRPPARPPSRRRSGARRPAREARRWRRPGSPARPAGRPARPAPAPSVRSSGCR